MPAPISFAANRSVVSNDCKRKPGKSSLLPLQLHLSRVERYYPLRFAQLTFLDLFCSGFVGGKFAQIPRGSNFPRTNFSRQGARVSGDCELTVKAHFLHCRRYTTNISELRGWELK